MTREEFQNILESSINEALTILRNNTPIDTGNMQNAWRIENTGSQFNIYLDTNKAPYAVYTTEPWKEGTNPNEGWAGRAFDLAIQILQRRLGGVLDKTIKDGDL